MNLTIDTTAATLSGNAMLVEGYHAGADGPLSPQQQELYMPGACACACGVCGVV